MKKIIETERLYLREMTQNDFDDLFAVLGDSFITQHYPYSFDENRVRGWIEKNIQRYKNEGFGLWAVCLKNTDEMIGDCGLTIQNIDGELLPEIGYHIRRDMQRQGFAKEAAKAVRDWGFKNTDYNEIYSYMKYTNVASYKTAISTGMKKVKEYPDSANGISYAYSISREEWENLRGNQNYMKKYVAFLRGINISGKNKIEMIKLKAEFEAVGFTEVSTYLNSGNVCFSCEESNPKKIIEDLIKEKFGFEIPVYVIEMEALKEIYKNSPEWWNSGNKEKYDNLIFILTDDSPEEICQLVGEPSCELEQIQIYKNVIFWSFDKAKYQKCNWWKKTAAVGIGEKLTIRTAGTVSKVCIN